MARPPKIVMPGRSIPAGYVMGRRSPGRGGQELVDISNLGQMLTASGVVAAPGGPSSPVTLTQPAAGLTITGGPYAFTFALANDLAALEGLGSTGLAARTGTDAWAQRTITGTASRISMTNGSGAAGNPTIDIDAAYVGQASITTLGTIGTGTWAGTVIAVNHGGTGQTSYADGEIMIGNTLTGGLTKATITAGSGVTVTNGNGSIAISASGGGGGSPGGSDKSIQFNNAGTFDGLGPLTNGQFLIGSTGANAVPATLTAGANISVTNGAGSSTVAVTAAGSDKAIQYNNNGPLGGLGPLTDGQLVIGSTGAAPAAAAITAGANISVTNGAGSVTIANVGTGLFNQVMSATPTSSNTGLTTWVHQGTATVSDDLTGVYMVGSASGQNWALRSKAAPGTTPYTITALVATNCLLTDSFPGIGIGWYDGTNKLHMIHLQVQNSPNLYVVVAKHATPGSASAGSDYVIQDYRPLQWLQISDDGTNAIFRVGWDGEHFQNVFSVAKASGYLGSTGYSNLVFGVNSNSAVARGTLLSWRQT